MDRESDSIQHSSILQVSVFSYNKPKINVATATKNGTHDDHGVFWCHFGSKRSKAMVTRLQNGLHSLSVCVYS